MAPVNASTEGELSSVQTNLGANNQSAHTLPKKGLKGLGRSHNNGQKKILWQFCRSYCVFDSGREAHL